MPAFVGMINVNTISGIFNVGDVRYIAPKSINKTFAGGGSFNSGTNLNVKNERSIINVYDSENQSFFIEKENETSIQNSS